MATAPKVSHQTAKQHAASVANLRKARAVARKLPRTGKQKAASRHNLAKARAAQKSRRSGKQATVKPQKAAAPLAIPGLPPPETASFGLGDDSSIGTGDAGQLRHMSQIHALAAAPDSRETSPLLHLLPACVPIVLAEHLRFWTGAEASDDEILALHELLGGAATISDAIEAAAEYGFSGFRPDSWARCDVSTRGVPGLIYGLPVPTGYHAVLALPAGVLSWGTVLSWPGEPAEAWHLEWEAI